MNRRFEHTDDQRGRSILKRVVVLLFAMSCGLLLGSILAPAKGRFALGPIWRDEPATQQYWIVPI